MARHRQRRGSKKETWESQGAPPAEKKRRGKPWATKSKVHEPQKNKKKKVTLKEEKKTAGKARGNYVRKSIQNLRGDEGKRTWERAVEQSAC